MGWLARWRADRARRAESVAILARDGITVHHYSNAFDTGPSDCPACGRGLRRLQATRTTTIKTGESVRQTVKAGYACLSCRISAPWDLSPIEEWSTFK